MTAREERGRGWRLILGDCMPVMGSMPEKSIDVILCDPPYEIEAHTKARRSLKDATQKRGAMNTGEVRRIDQPLEITFDAITSRNRRRAARLFGALARRWVIAFCQIEAIGEWRHALTLGPLEWVRGGVWLKPNGAPQFTGDRPGQGFESLAIAHQPGKKRWSGGGKHAVWSVPLDHRAGGGGQAEHPTMKPIALMMELIADFTDRDELVLDPFAGSGTTGVACLRSGRRFVGIEKDPKFFRLACERLRAEESGSTLAAARAGQTPLFGCAR